MCDQLLSHGIVKTRKQHRCVLCGLRIRKGTTSFKDSGIWDGEFYFHRFHLVCYDAWFHLDNDGEFLDESEFRHNVLGLPLLRTDGEQ